MMRVLLFAVWAILAVTSVSAFAPASFHIRTPHHNRSPVLFVTATQDITGTVKWYNIERGYGFIARDDGEPDMYVHATGLLTDGPIKEGDHVQFATEMDRRTKKLKAVGVELTGNASPASPTLKPVKEAPAPKAETKKSTVNPNQRALLEAKLQNDQAAKANAKKVKSLQDEKLHRSLLDAKLKNDEASKEKAAAAAEEAVAAAKAAEKERARLAKEAEEKHLAEEAEKKRLAEEAEKKRLAEEAENARIAAEAEKARLAKEAEEKRIAEEEAKAAAAVAAALAAEEESLKQKALFFGWDIETYKARTAYLDPDKAAKLAAKYAAIDDLGEKLFTILVDLKMVEIHPDP